MDARQWRIAAVLVVGMLVVGGLVAATGSGDDGDSFESLQVERDRRAGDDDTVEDSTDDDVTDDDVTDDDVTDDDDDVDDHTSSSGDELADFVAEAIAFIEQERELTFLEDPVVRVVPDAEFVALLDADLAETFDEDPELVEEYTVLYRALRLIDDDETIDEEYRAFGDAGVLGFYDPETKELVVRAGDGLSLMTKSTIVHELVHALDDQRFDLDRPEYDDLTDEIPWTFSAVVEGSASYFESRWVATLSAQDQRDLEAEELAFGDPGVFDEFTFAFLISELSVYFEGEPFVEHLVDDGGLTALDRALLDPPTSSEQVMTPDLYPGEEPVVVPAPPADGDVVWSGVGGQVIIDSLLSEVLFGSELSAAGNGWGGDAMVAWRDGDQSCIRWDIVADHGNDLRELSDAMALWASADAGASISSPRDGVLRVDSCK